MRDVWTISIQTLDVVTNECSWEHFIRKFMTRRGAMRYLVRSGFELCNKDTCTFDAITPLIGRYVRYAYVERIQDGNMW